MMDRRRVAVLAGKMKPRDPVIFRPSNLEAWLVRLIRISGHSIEPIRDQQESLIHIGADGELKLQTGLAL